MVTRKNIFFYIVYTVIQFYCMTTYGESNSRQYVWPVEIAGNISGNFGECRWDHFHVGLDIATHQKTGFEIYAIADGYVDRMKASPAGYGRVLYLQLDDGSRVVYAHLDRFVPALQQALSDYQHKMEQYTVDMHIPDERYRFKQGDTIGYSGKSGDVAPHLHIELRTQHDEPLNILTHGLTLPQPDTTLPRVSHVCFKPASPASFIEGAHTQLIVPVKSVSAQHYTFDTVDVYGSIGIKAAVSDTDNTGRYTLAVESISLIVDDLLAYSVAFNKIGYNTDYNHNFLVYDRELRYLTPDSLQGDYVRLFSLMGKDLQTTAFATANNGYIHCGLNTLSSTSELLSEGIHSIRIEVKDAQGNLSICEGSLNVVNPHGHKYAVPWTGKPVPAIDIQLSRFENFFSIDVIGREKIPDMNAMVKMGERTITPLFAVRQTDENIHYVFQPAVTYDGVGMAVVSVGQQENESIVSTVSIPVNFMAQTGGTFTSDDGKLQLVVDANTRSFAPSAQMTTDFTDPPGIRRVSDVYRIRPAGFELSQKAVVRMYVDRVDAVIGALAVLEWMNGQWKLLSQVSQQKHGWVAAAVTHLSTFAVFADDTPPAITFVSPEKNSGVQEKLAVIRCTIYDEGIGIAHRSLVMKINGKKVPAEYIFDQTLFTYTLLQPLPRGMNIIEITAADRLDNAVIKRIEFMCTEE